jgi:hypothetical protein
VDILVPGVLLRPSGYSRRLEGAAWSCAVDAALNGPAAWTRDDAGDFLWADEVPRLDELSPADCVAY